MLIGYGKLGRAVSLDPTRWGVNGGDNEPLAMIEAIHEAYPDAQIVMISKCTDRSVPDWVINPWQGYKPPVYNAIKGIDNGPAQQAVVDTIYNAVLKPLVSSIDYMVMWLGQHSSTSNSIPTVGSGEASHPLVSSMAYAGPQVQFINDWQAENEDREVTWLNADVRNYFKARDIKMPPRLPILTQMNYTHAGKNFRYGDKRDPSDLDFNAVWADDEHTVWKSQHTYVYSGLELCGVPATDTPNTSETRKYRFGMIAHEAKGDCPFARVETVKEWTLDTGLAEYLYGSWRPESQETLGRKVASLPYDQVIPTMAQTKYMLTTPTSGSGWPTAKFWECSSVGTLCFLHPDYDTQNHLLGSRPDIAEWLRVKSPAQMIKAMDYLDANPDVYTQLVRIVHDFFMQRKNENQIIEMIKERIK